MARNRTTTPTPREGRRPMIAGNWKMNLTHLEAIGLVQKLAFSLKPAQLDAAEVVVLPPFTAARSACRRVPHEAIEATAGSSQSERSVAAASPGNPASRALLTASSTRSKRPRANCSAVSGWDGS